MQVLMAIKRVFAAMNAVAQSNGSLGTVPGMVSPAQVRLWYHCSVLSVPPQNACVANWGNAAGGHHALHDFSLDVDCEGQSVGVVAQMTNAAPPCASPGLEPV